MDRIRLRNNQANCIDAFGSATVLLVGAALAHYVCAGTSPGGVAGSPISARTSATTSSYTLSTCGPSSQPAPP
jgi:hypothetical protein|eukprot:COSAG02_NODE_4967_length_4773_cov_44.423834_5_plen_73_part_00